MYDIIIIGAGPAGLTAAIYARRANKSVLLLEKGAFGGQITFSPKVENYPGFASLSGTELADHFVEQALGLGADVEIETVIGIEDKGTHKVVLTEDGAIYEGKAVIIAAGARHRHLGLPNEETHIGEGISFCAVCDGAFYKDKTVALVGGGNSALQEAILLSETSAKVYVVQNLDHLTGEPALQDIIAKRDNVEVLLGTVVEALPATAPLTSITLRRVADDHVYDLSVDGVFVAIGLQPENDAFASVAALDERGYVDAGEDCLTNTPGVFVAGDCRRKAIRQVATATGDGAVAALSACQYIDSL